MSLREWEGAPCKTYVEKKLGKILRTVHTVGKKNGPHSRDASTRIKKKEEWNEWNISNEGDAG